MFKYYAYTLFAVNYVVHTLKQYIYAKHRISNLTICKLQTCLSGITPDLTLR